MPGFHLSFSERSWGPEGAAASCVPTGTECVHGDDLFHASFQWSLDLASPHSPFASVPGQSSPQAQNLPGLASW